MSEQPATNNTIRWHNRHYTKMCQSPFVIWFRERSGSTFLCSMLKSHPDIFCRYEDFDLFGVDREPPSSPDVPLFFFNTKYFYRRLKGLNAIIENPQLQQSIDHLRDIFSRPKTACGFKLKFELQVAGYPEIVEELHWMSHTLRVLVLQRRNLLKQAVSRQNMERLQNANVKSKQSLPPLSLDVDRAVKYAQYIKTQDKRFCRSASRFDNTKTIFYEDLQTDPQRIMTEILEFLDVDTECQLSSVFHKATPDTLSSAISNYSELAEFVAGTELESMLD